MIGMGTFDSSGVSGPVRALFGPSLPSSPDGPSLGAIFKTLALFFFKTRKTTTTHRAAATMRNTRMMGTATAAGDIPVCSTAGGSVGEDMGVGVAEGEGRGEGV